MNLCCWSLNHWCSVHESFRAFAVDGIHRSLTLFEDKRCLSLMNHGWREQSKSAVTMFEVIPGEELLEESLSMEQALETLWKSWSVLQGFELSFRIGIVVAHMRSAVTLGHAKVGQEMSHLFGSHARPPVGVQRQLIGFDLLSSTARTYQLIGQN